MDSLGIDVDASDSDNMRTFKKVTVSTEVFKYDEVVVWFRMLSKISKCQGLAACVEDEGFFRDTGCMRKDSLWKTKGMKAATGSWRTRKTGAS